MTEEPHRPPACPQCGSSSIASIMYGYPAFGEELGRRLEAKEIVLGGCVITPGCPRWHCHDCGRRFGRYDPPEGESLGAIGDQ